MNLKSELLSKLRNNGKDKGCKIFTNRLVPTGFDPAAVRKCEDIKKSRNAQKVNGGGYLVAQALSWPHGWL